MRYLEKDKALSLSQKTVADSRNRPIPNRIAFNSLGETII